MKSKSVGLLLCATFLFSCSAQPQSNPSISKVAEETSLSLSVTKPTVSFSEFVSAYARTWESLSLDGKNVFPKKAKVAFTEKPTQYKASIDNSPEGMGKMLLSEGELAVSLEFTLQNGPATIYQGKIVSATYDGEDADQSDNYLAMMVYNAVPYAVPLYQFVSFTEEEGEAWYYEDSARRYVLAPDSKRISQEGGKTYATLSSNNRIEVAKTYVKPTDANGIANQTYSIQNGFQMEYGPEGGDHYLIKTNQDGLIQEFIKDFDGRTQHIQYTY